MKKNILRKDFIIEIKKTMDGLYRSFLSWHWVSHFIRESVHPSQVCVTADQYFDDSELMDLKVMGTMDLPKRISKRLERYRELKL